MENILLADNRDFHKERTVLNNGGLLYAALFSVLTLEFNMYFFLEGRINGVLSKGHYLDWIATCCGFLIFGLFRAKVLDAGLRKTFLVVMNVLFFFDTGLILFIDASVIVKVLLVITGVALGSLSGAVCYFVAAKFYMSPRCGTIMAISVSVPYIIQYFLGNLFENRTFHIIFLVVTFSIITFIAVRNPSDFILEDALPFSQETPLYEKELKIDKIKVVVCFMLLLIICIFMEHSWHEAVYDNTVNMYGLPRLAAVLGYFFIGIIADYKKHKYLDLAIICVFLLSVIGFYDRDYTLIRLAFFYFFAGVYTGYLYLAFWYVAPKTKMPDIWACLGRILSIFEGVIAFFIMDLVRVKLLEQIGLGIGVGALLIFVYLFKDRGVEKIEYKPKALTDKGGDRGEPPGVLMNSNKGMDDLEQSASNTDEKASAEKILSENECFIIFCRERNLTPREMDVMRILLDSDDNMKSIAERLNISERMLYRYMNSLYEKIGSENRAGLVKKYYER